MRASVRRGGGWAILLAAALALGGCTSSAAGRQSGPRAVSKGGTVYFAQLNSPNWIFPFVSNSYFTSQNVTQFQYLMYRPLYWFGQVGSETVSFNEPLSLALPPAATNDGRTAVITLKGWKFSDGQRVDAQSVVFWMNMMMAEGRANNPACSDGPCWGGSTPNGFPYNVVGYSAPEGANGDVVDISFDGGYSTTWLLYNALSQITPMPEAWDITGLHRRPGSGGCGAVSRGEMNGATTNSACEKVWSFDTDDNGTSAHPEMSGDLNSYSTNPLWQVVDGPWRLSSYDISSGKVTLVPNRHYSGGQRPIIAKFVESRYTSDGAVLAALAAGGLDAPGVAPISTADLPVNNGPPDDTTGPNLRKLSSRYRVDLSFQWYISYSPENYTSTEDSGVTKWLFRQLYIRQVLQMLVDQPELIRTAARGYGVPVYGPVPVFPASPFVSRQEVANPYPYDPARAKQLLQGHGWTINPDAADVCNRPGTAPDECGRGVPRGAPLRFMLLYAEDEVWKVQLAVSEGAAWAKVGIEVEPIGRPFFTVTQTALPCRTPGTPACAWAMANWGGWTFLPDYMPTGEYLFSAGGVDNVGSYDDAETDRLIVASERSDNLGSLYRYEDYLAKQLPVLWQPSNAVTAFEVSKSLDGVGQLSPLLTLTPEYWYWTTASHP